MKELNELLLRVYNILNWYLDDLNDYSVMSRSGATKNYCDNVSEKIKKLMSDVKHYATKKIK